MSNESTINFLGYYVREMNFSKNDHFKGGKVNLDIKFTKNSTYLDKNRVRMNVNVRLFNDTIDDNHPFTLSFIISGLFQYHNVNIEIDSMRNMIETKMIDILYPYIRMIVSSVLTMANLPPLYLPAININQFIKDKDLVN